MDFKRWGLLLLVILALDAVWLTLRYSYHAQLFASIQGSPLVARWVPAIIVYLILATILYFSTKDARTWKDAGLRGAATGALVYGFYDFTNYATLTRYTLEMTLVDTAWGAFVSASSAAVTAFLLPRF
jgi:uncharacterized membrane protein